MRASPITGSLVLSLLLLSSGCDQSVDAPVAPDASRADGAPLTDANPDDQSTSDAAPADTAVAAQSVKVTYLGQTTTVALDEPTPVTFEGRPHALLSDVVALGVGSKALETLQAGFTSSDGFTPDSKSLCEGLIPVDGSLFVQGYIDVATRMLSWAPELQYPGCLYVKDLAEITVSDT